MPDFTPIVAIQYPTATDLIRSNSHPAKLASDIQDTALSAERAITTQIGGVRDDLGELEDRVETVETMDRPSQETIDQVNTLSGQVSGLIDDAETQHRAVLDSAQAAQDAAHLVGAPADEAVAAMVTGDSDTRAALLGTLGQVLSVNAFGATGDGTTDDTAALRAAFASGMTVRLERDSVYNYDPTIGPLVITEGTRVHAKGAKLYETSSIDEFRLIVESNTFVDRLDISAAGGDAARGVLLDGEDIEIGSVRIIARSRAGEDNFRRRALSIGKENGTNSNIRIGHIYIQGWDYTTSIYDANDITIGTLTARDYKQNLVIRDSKRCTVRGGSTDVLSPNAFGTPGENAVLIEATKGDFTVEDILIENYISEISGEHGYRIGGQHTVRGVTWNNCTARRAGSGIGSGVDPENHGGCGFKVLGPTSNTASSARHENIKIINPTVENLNPSREKDNFSGISVGKTYDIQIINPVVRAVPETGYGPGDYAAYDGIEVVGSENVIISNPIIRDCANAGISIIDGPDTSSMHWGVEDSIRIIGGLLRHNGKYGIEIRDPQKMLRRINVDGTQIDGGEYALFQTAGTGALSNQCSARIVAWNQSVATASGIDTWVLDITGNERGTLACRIGSMITDYDSGARKIRKSSGWVTL